MLIENKKTLSVTSQLVFLFVTEHNGMDTTTHNLMTHEEAHVHCRVLNFKEKPILYCSNKCTNGSVHYIVSKSSRHVSAGNCHPQGSHDKIIDLTIAGIESHA